MKMSDQYACEEYRAIMPQMEKFCGYAPNNIPQLQNISDYLAQTTGFTLRPVQGLLSARDFLNALAFRVFFSTQYIRHHGNPYYTPEPDICHELIGHVPMFADPSFAEFSHKIGLASLAASDEDIDRLASCYWFTVEFGVLREGNDIKAYGAGLLSSFGEMEWACANKPSIECRESGGMMQHHPDLEKPELRPFNPLDAAVQPFPITTYQPVFYCADSLNDAKKKMDSFCDSLARPFFPQYEPLTQSIVISKAVTRAPRTTTLHRQSEKQKEYFENLGREASSAKIAGQTEEEGDKRATM
jgi:phenylalanine-4-hydroxylase